MVKPRSTNPRVLLCNCFRRYPSDYLDYIGENVYGTPRVSNPRRIGFGLRFLKQNVPEIEILEYPLWHQYICKLKQGWDVVGFSFFQNEVADVERMAAAAREHGVKEIWAGGHGALDGHVPAFADRVFIGAAEDDVARVFGYRVPDSEIQHPVLHMPMRFMPGRIPHFMYGLLYTERGCPFKCSFCQTPVFECKRFKINLESIDRVLAYYKKVGVTDVLLLDELFGIYPKHAEVLSDMLARYRFRWWTQSRASLFLHNLDKWYDRGLRFPLIGLETMNQKALDSIDKKQKVDEIIELSRKTGEKPGMYRMVYYMIGYENMNLAETLEDVAAVKAAGFDAHQVNILTPFPKTPLWDELNRKYGIFDKTYRHYDVKHLVWNHPYISPAQMKYLLHSTIAYLNRPMDIYGKGFVRLIKDRFKSSGLNFVWRDLLKGPIAAALINDRKQVFFPRN
ncbi:radical SAM protein [candidate division WOR-3 bacterium]|uniref:Radical SAM protein n=1 Tax=candidate division WOR-3 bacterium TaxID=2052148 RepID=A0A9D5QDQ8_UNCW3|nr:radical SAM protein [candidate division WOR-3 bacterium]MBD3364305.1 radical SAM protein [candidate division WOR-3 bacterium]